MDDDNMEKLAIETLIYKSRRAELQRKLMMMVSSRPAPSADGSIQDTTAVVTLLIFSPFCFSDSSQSATLLIATPTMSGLADLLQLLLCCQEGMEGRLLAAEQQQGQERAIACPPS
ncbi:hypothetical protein UY3_04108 [Chelonia mydas]|uniref:Uncharacterized protein n=1 Tax=Chelonia mydas TaxID=8469 RepID=M7BNI5_CHEMY|nr:hypothetical protein UY3_04108 [Chelonia mydas]